MGFIGSDSMASQSLMNSVDFAPIIQFGQDLDSNYDKTNEQSSAFTPKLDSSTDLAASVGVGIGGDGSGGMVGLTTSEDTQQPTDTGVLGDLSSINPLYLGVGAVVLGLGGYFMFKKKKKKKA